MLTTIQGLQRATKRRKAGKAERLTNTLGSQAFYRRAYGKAATLCAKAARLAKLAGDSWLANLAAENAREALYWLRRNA